MFSISTDNNGVRLAPLYLLSKHGDILALKTGISGEHSGKVSRKSFDTLFFSLRNHLNYLLEGKKKRLVSFCRSVALNIRLLSVPSKCVFELLVLFRISREKKVACIQKYFKAKIIKVFNSFDILNYCYISQLLILAF